MSDLTNLADQVVTRVTDSRKGTGDVPGDPVKDRLLLLGALYKGIGAGTETENAVLYVDQTLDTDQQQRARDNIGAADAYQVAEDISNLTTNTSNNLSMETGYRTQGDLDVMAYADTLVMGLLDDRGNHNASGNTFPSSGGSGTAGAVLKGDLWTISVAGTLGGVAVTTGDVIRAKSDAPGQTAGNWVITENNLGYVPQNTAGTLALSGFSSITGTIAISNIGSLGTGVGAALAVSLNSAGGFATIDGTATLSNKTLTNPTVNNYTEGVVAIGTVTSSSTLSLTSGTVQTATLTASTACTFTMPTATAGKSFMLLLKQAAATGNGTATFTGVKWGTAGAPTITATAGKMDILTFVADGTNWYGSITQGYTP